MRSALLMVVIALISSIFLPAPSLAQDFSRFPGCSDRKILQEGNVRQLCQPLPEVFRTYSAIGSGDNKVKPCAHDSLWVPGQEQFNRIIASHENWLQNAETGERANLCGADLREIELPEGESLDLSGAILSSADLSGQDFSGATLNGANLCSAVFKGTLFNRVEANHAIFWHAQAAKSDFSNASLCGASFSGAKLNSTNFWNANLRSATLKAVEVNETRFTHANLSNVRYEPLKGLPEPYLGTISGLTQMHAKSYPRGLTQLRHVAILSGNREQERELSASIARLKALEKLPLEKPSDVFQAASSLLFVAFVGMPTNWGLSLWIPFVLLVSSFLGFGLIYYRHIRASGGRIVIVRPGGRIISRDGRLALSESSELIPADGILRRKAAKYAILYSLQTTFFFVTDSLKVSNWVNRLNPDEERVAGIGGMRTLGGIQSVFSLYLIALLIAVGLGDLFA